MKPKLQRPINAALHSLDALQDEHRTRPGEPMPLYVPVPVGTFNLLLFILEELAQEQPR